MKTIKLSGGRSVTMRPPTLEEVLAYLDRRADVEAGLRPSNDATDDGDRQLEACVTDPVGPELADLLEDFPLLNQVLAELFKDLAGGDKMLFRRDDLIGPEYQRAGKRLVGFLFDPPAAPVRGEDEADEAFTARQQAHEAQLREQLIVLTKFSRFEIKALEFEVRKQGRKGPLPSVLAAAAKQHVVTLAERAGHRDRILAVFGAAPLLVPNLGLQLFRAASAVVEEDLGKA